MAMHTSGPGNVDEATCKIEPVQKEVARLVGWQVSLNAVSGMESNTIVLNVRRLSLEKDF